jgi:hypothetical protein
MNKRDKTIVRWVEDNRPDLVDHITHILSAPAGDSLEGIQLCMSIAFEAGRTFQFNNPSTTLHDPNIYLK